MCWMKVTHSRDADVTVLLNATFEGSVHHESALDWLMRARSDSQGLGLFSNVLVSFMRISTDRRIYEEPLSLEDSMRFVDGLLASPHVRVINPARQLKPGQTPTCPSTCSPTRLPKVRSCSTHWPPVDKSRCHSRRCRGVLTSARSWIVSARVGCSRCRRRARPARSPRSALPRAHGSRRGSGAPTPHLCPPGLQGPSPRSACRGRTCRCRRSPW